MVSRIEHDQKLAAAIRLSDALDGVLHRPVPPERYLAPWLAGELCVQCRSAGADALDIAILFLNIKSSAR